MEDGVKRPKIHISRDSRRRGEFGTEVIFELVAKTHPEIHQATHSRISVNPPHTQINEIHKWIHHSENAEYQR